MAAIYGNGLKYYLDKYKEARAMETDESPESFSDESSRRYKDLSHILRDVHIFYFEPWATALEWPNGPYFMPEPFVELTFEEYMRLGPCGFESEGSRFFQCFNIKGEYEWFGGSSSYVQFYSSYALVVMTRHVYLESFDGNKWDIGDVGKGQIITRGDDEVSRRSGYVVRYFRIGCEHDRVPDPENPSRMFEHNSMCSKCGMKFSVDSSG